MKTYEYWLKYYENATKEQVIEDSMHDIEEITNLQQENKHLNLQLDQALKDYEELLTKIDKATRYINVQKLDYRNDDRIIFIFKKLNEILGDKENVKN